MILHKLIWSWLGLGYTLSPFVLDLLNRSMAAVWLLLAALLLRLLLRRGPKWVRCLLWALVALRLVLPVHIPSPLSALGGSGAPVNETGQVEYIRELTRTTQPWLELRGPLTGQTARLGQVEIETTNHIFAAAPLTIASALWPLGTLVMLAYALISLLRLRRRLREAVRLEEGVWLSDRIDSPFLLGFFRPRVYIPADLEEKLREPVLRHERAHLRRGDPWWKVLGWLLLCVYWFHPLLWLSYFLFCRDLELACDERAIRELDEEDRKGYASALLTCSLPGRARLLSPLSFGETGVKTRLRAVADYKKPAFWLILLAILLCVAAAVFFGTDPVAPGSPSPAWVEPELSPELAEAVHTAVLERNWNAYGGEGYPAEAHVVLALEEDDREATVWLYVCYVRVAWDGTRLEDTCGGSAPARIRFLNDRGRYIQAEYWEALGGEKYQKELRENLPSYVSPDQAIYVADKYRLKLAQSCYAQAVTYYWLDAAPLLETLLTDLLDTGGEEPDDCFHNAPRAYHSLLSLGEYTFRWAISQFLAGDQEGLRGALLWRLIQETEETSAGHFNVNNTLATPQACFDAWLKSLENGEKAYGIAHLEKLFPAEALALKLSRGEA